MIIEVHWRVRMLLPHGLHLPMVLPTQYMVL